MGAVSFALRLANGVCESLGLREAVLQHLTAGGSVFLSSRKTSFPPLIASKSLLLSFVVMWRTVPRVVATKDSCKLASERTRG